jgi:glutamate/tyrosine decarboxylase-like PLP-dependent enzyme
VIDLDPEEFRNNPRKWLLTAFVDYRDWQVALGRRFRALKLWTVLHAYGLERLQIHIRSDVALAEGLAERVRGEPSFALAAPPSLALVYLRMDSGDSTANDEATRAVVTAASTRGRAFAPTPSSTGATRSASPSAEWSPAPTTSTPCGASCATPPPSCDRASRVPALPTTRPVQAGNG